MAATTKSRRRRRVTRGKAAKCSRCRRTPVEGKYHDCGVQLTLFRKEPPK